MFTLHAAHPRSSRHPVGSSEQRVRWLAGVSSSWECGPEGLLSGARTAHTLQGCVHVGPLWWSGLTPAPRLGEGWGDTSTRCSALPLQPESEHVVHQELGPHCDSALRCVDLPLTGYEGSPEPLRAGDNLRLPPPWVPESIRPASEVPGPMATTRLGLGGLWWACGGGEVRQ